MNQYINFIESDNSYLHYKIDDLQMLFFYTKVLQSIDHAINILYSNFGFARDCLQNKDKTKEDKNYEFCPANQDSSHLYAWRYQ